MFWRIEVKEKQGFYDAAGEAVRKDIADLGFRGRVREVRTSQVYLLEGNLRETEVRRICEELLIDPVSQEYTYKDNAPDEEKFAVVEVAYNPGVMDPVEDSAKKAISDLGIKGVRAVKTAKKYLIHGKLSRRDIDLISENILYNKVIQHVARGRSRILPEVPPYQFKLTHVNITGANDRQLNKLSRDGQLFLNLDEMKAIKEYFGKLKRNPTDCELETVAQTWSEHCKHKTFRGGIEFEGKVIKNLLKSTIMKVTDEL